MRGLLGQLGPFDRLIVARPDPTVEGYFTPISLPLYPNMPLRKTMRISDRFVEAHPEPMTEEPVTQPCYTCSADAIRRKPIPARTKKSPEEIAESIIIHTRPSKIKQANSLPIHTLPPVTLVPPRRVFTKAAWIPVRMGMEAGSPEKDKVDKASKENKADKKEDKTKNLSGKELIEACLTVFSMGVGLGLLMFICGCIFGSRR
jgi:hypothetical protein